MNKQVFPWHSRFDLLGITFLLFLAASTERSPPLKARARPRLLGNLLLAAQFFPPDWSIWTGPCLGFWKPSKSPWSLPSRYCFSFHFGGSRMAPPWVLWPTRMLLNLIRTIPSLLWALLAVVIVGSNSLVASSHLLFTAWATWRNFLAKPLNPRTSAPKKHLPLGAGLIQAFQYGLWLNARPIIWSHCLWMLSTMYARPASLDMWVRAVSGYTSSSMLNLLIVGINFHSFTVHPGHRPLLDFAGEKIRKSIRDKLEGTVD